MTKDGDYVLAEGGNRIQIPNANLVKISVNQAGEIYSGNTYVAKLQLVDFQSYDALSSYGENMYEAVDGAVQTQQSIRDIWKCQMSIWSQRWLI